MSIQIEIGSAADIVAISKQIPEFRQVTTLERLQARLDGRPALILIAKAADTIVGYKVGYHLTEDTFYSWLGGVLPDYRRQGFAALLLRYQEQWARDAGYQQIQVKSMACFPAMLALLRSNGYQVLAADESADRPDDKIVFLKSLVAHA